MRPSDNVIMAQIVYLAVPGTGSDGDRSARPNKVIDQKRPIWGYVHLQMVLEE